MESSIFLLSCHRLISLCISHFSSSLEGVDGSVSKLIFCFCCCACIRQTLTARRLHQHVVCRAAPRSPTSGHPSVNPNLKVVVVRSNVSSRIHQSKRLAATHFNQPSSSRLSPSSRWTFLRHQLLRESRGLRIVFFLEDQSVAWRGQCA